MDRPQSTLFLHKTSSVIVLEVHGNRILPRPAECDAVIRTHPNRPAPWVALKEEEAKACNIHVLGPRRDHQKLQYTNAFPRVFGAAAPGLSDSIEFFEP